MIMIYAVTGSTGPFGSTAIRRLLDWNIPATSIVAIARSPEKAAALSSLGVSVRYADYSQPAALEAALKGADRLLLVSGSEVGKRAEQHRNVIDAAKKGGVKLVAYTSISRADTSSNPLASEHAATETLIKDSGIPFVILRNNWYTENYIDALTLARTTGIIEAAAGKGKVCSATRSDYAEAAARALRGEGHAGSIYELGGEAWDYDDLARVASELLGRSVVYKPVSLGEREASLTKAGLPQGVASFVASLDAAIERGTLAYFSTDMEKLLGRKPRSLAEGLRSALA
jgi:NAD(P)H dehydrogenase (quinone)